VDFLSDVQLQPDDYNVSFNESWLIYDRRTGESLAGKDWSSYNVTLKSFATVPAPSA